MPGAGLVYSRAEAPPAWMKVQTLQPAAGQSAGLVSNRALPLSTPVNIEALQPGAGRDS